MATLVCPLGLQLHMVLIKHFQWNAIQYHLQPAKYESSPDLKWQTTNVHLHSQRMFYSWKC